MYMSLLQLIIYIYISLLWCFWTVYHLRMQKKRGLTQRGDDLVVLVEAVHDLHNLSDVLPHITHTCYTRSICYIYRYDPL